MQYDAIILELLSRIKKLEDEIKALKTTQDNLLQGSLQMEDRTPNEDDLVLAEPSTPYKKMTDEMIDMCYLCGKKAHEGENAQELAEEISEATGMNKSSAVMYLYAVKGMLEGTVYKRAISAKAMQKYFDNIFNEYGSKGLRKALQATRLHIIYRKECGHTVDSIEEIYNRYERKL